ncbi:Calcium-transporting ATPase 3 like protein [Verticillium longisporum]|uniref:Calcium-transporting ATPase 3 like protein n=1 Tax=Verticillium longisporum TaxID=100787 RepID=A0A8I2ZG82_VERLO|nr:Calcium-transporting ATPase 3 like protein [Verticillium longisporum]
MKQGLPPSPSSTRHPWHAAAHAHLLHHGLHVRHAATTGHAAAAAKHLHEAAHVGHAAHAGHTTAAAAAHALHALLHGGELLGLVAAGGISVFPVVYIPYVNHNLFKHTGITWEWGVAVAFTILFVFGIEAWKFVKRTFGLLESGAVVRGSFNQGEESTGAGMRRTMTMSSFKEWASFSRSNTQGRRSRSQSRSGPHRATSDVSGSTQHDGATVEQKL